MFLNAEQLRELTKKQRPSAQARELSRLCIKHGVRSDGSIVVMESAVDAVLGPGASAKLRKTAPNLAMVS